MLNVNHTPVPEQPGGKKRKKRRPGLNAKLFRSFIIFTLIIVVSLWLCMGVFLGTIYRGVRRFEVTRAASALSSHTGSADFQTVASDVVRHSELNVTLLKLNAFGSFMVLASAKGSVNSMTDNLRGEAYVTLFTMAEENGGTILKTYRYDPSLGSYVGADNADADCIISSTVIEAADGTVCLLLVDSYLSPVDATVNSIRFMLILMTVILILVAALTSWMLSVRLAKPLARMSESAKSLARGDYDTKFDGKGYRESETLASALNYASDELKKVDTLRKELIANISHDLRTPLTMISGYAEIMRDLPGENTPENVQTIIDEANRLTILVNDLLDISKLETGNQTVICEEFSLTDALSETARTLSKLAKQEGITIVFDRSLPDNSENIELYTDRNRLMQAVNNLINNAFVYCGEDGLVILRQLRLADGRVSVEVEDHGCGIAADQLSLIWDRYYRAGTGTGAGNRKKTSGSGLGLSIVKSTMNLLGGSYGVTSTPGAGSVFRVTLPASAVVADDDLPEGSGEPVGESAGTTDEQR